MPPGLVLYALDAAYEGPSPALRRYYVDAEGNFHSDQLLVSHGAWTDPGARNLIDVTFGPGGQVVANLCHGGCYGTVDPVTLMSSPDGGVTWTGIHTFPDGGVRALTAHGDILVREYPPAEGDGDGRLLLLSEPGKPFPLPPGVSDRGHYASGAGAGETLVVAIAEDARTVWSLYPTQERIGSLPPGLNADDTNPQMRILPASDGLRLIVEWWVGPTQFVGLLADAEGEFEAVLTPDTETVGSSFNLTHWLSETRAIGWASVLAPGLHPGGNDGLAGIPAIIDVSTGAVAPIADFADLSIGKAGGPVPVYVLEGEFLEVTGAGTCLNVRESPNTSAAVLTCYADGVLLPVRTGVAAEEGWLPVSTLDGRPGWAASDYLAPATSP